jgi:hypothetical protein
MLRLGSEIWPRTLEHFRRCGAGRNECVVFWVAHLDAVDEVDTVVHPVHGATPSHYAPTRSWLDQFWPRLVRERRTVRAQVHTHGGRAFHSSTDDLYPLVHTPGFLSLVVPLFAKDGIAVDDLYLAEIDQIGRWRAVRVRDRIEGLR